MILDLRRHPWLGLLVVALLTFFDPGKWAVWHYRATIVNDGTNTGNHLYNFVPGAGNILILLGGHFLNGDIAGRQGLVTLVDSDGVELRRILFSVSVGAGKRREFPTSEVSADDGNSAAEAPVVASGTEELRVQIQSLAINQNTEVAIQFLVSGGAPTVGLTSPTGAVETETENRIV